MMVMPVISRFLGIEIRMYYADHPPPHFHAEYGEYEIAVEIHSQIVTGRFPPRALKSVLEWGYFHRDELLGNWELAGRNESLSKIAPLE
jgi:hypothetical protein